MLFPNDALSARQEYTGNFSNQLLLDVPTGETYTVLYEGFNTGYTTAGADLMIFCGSTRLLTVDNMGVVPAIERFKMVRCDQDIEVKQQNTLGTPATTTVAIIYVPYNTSEIATTTMDTSIIENNLTSLNMILGFFFFFFIFAGTITLFRKK